MAGTALSGLLFDQELVLRLLRPLIYNNPSPFSALILNGVVSNNCSNLKNASCLMQSRVSNAAGAVEVKQVELKRLTKEVVMLFERIWNVLDWNLVYDICRAHGRVVVLPQEQHESLRYIDVYCDHLDALYLEGLREEILREFDSSPSSDDSYSR